MKVHLNGSEIYTHTDTSLTSVLKMYLGSSFRKYPSVTVNKRVVVQILWDGYILQNGDLISINQPAQS